MKLIVDIFKDIDRDKCIFFLLNLEVTMKILNLSNHQLTKEQIDELTDQGFTIVELDEKSKKLWGQLNPENYKDVVDDIFERYSCECYHIAGFAPAIVYVCRIINSSNRKAVYAYSERKTVEKQEDGKVVKTSILEHKGFYLY